MGECVSLSIVMKMEGVGGENVAAPCGGGHHAAPVSTIPPAEHDLNRKRRLMVDEDRHAAAVKMNDRNLA